VPVVSTDLGGTKEIFIENKEALFYQAGDIQALAEKILYLSQNRSAAHRIAERAQGKVMREHCLDDYLDTITAKIKELIGEDA
jgi:glycosyltransferase involved in cell wall biosynthesis